MLRCFPYRLYFSSSLAGQFSLGAAWAYISKACHYKSTGSYWKHVLSRILSDISVTANPFKCRRIVLQLEYYSFYCVTVLCVNKLKPTTCSAGNSFTLMTVYPASDRALWPTRSSISCHQTQGPLGTRLLEAL